MIHDSILCFMTFLLNDSNRYQETMLCLSYMFKNWSLLKFFYTSVINDIEVSYFSFPFQFLMRTLPRFTGSELQVCPSKSQLLHAASSLPWPECISLVVQEAHPKRTDLAIWTLIFGCRYSWCTCRANTSYLSGNMHVEILILWVDPLIWFGKKFYVNELPMVS